MHYFQVGRSFLAVAAMSFIHCRISRALALMTTALGLLTTTHAATYTVTTTAASGAGSFLEAFTSANIAGESHSILFDSTAFDPATRTVAERTITLGANLASWVASGLTLNGDVNGDLIPDVIIDGAAAYSGINAVNASSVTIQSMVLRNFRSTAATVPTVLRLAAAGSSLTIRDCVLSENRNTAVALGGGALIVLHLGNSLSIDRCAFYSNFHGLNGGALYCVPTNAVIANSVFYDNEAGGSASNQGGGAIRYQANQAGSALNLFNCTIVGNRVPNGSAVGGGVGLSSTAGAIVNLHDSVVVENTGPGGVASDIGTTGSGSYTVNNVSIGSGSGMFVNLGSGASRDLRLATSSPVIDYGSASSTSPAQDYDLLGNPRWIGSYLDRGAYEYAAGRSLDLDADNSSGASGTAFSATGSATQNVTLNVADSDAALGSLASDTNIRSVSFVLSGDLDSGETLLLSGSHPNINAVVFDASKRFVLYSKTNASAADMQAAVRNVSYRNSAASPSSGARSVSVFVSDASDSATAVATLTLSSANSAPTDIALSNGTVNQSAGVNASVGTLSTTDADGSDSHTYTLVSGAGDTHNSAFSISGSALRANDPAALTPGNYSVRVRTNDGHSGSYEEVFAIVVVDDIAPQTISIHRKSPTAQTIRTNQVVFEVTFSEPVSGLAATNFIVTRVSGGTVSTTVSGISGGPTVYEVTVDVGAGAGEFRLDLGPMRSLLATGFSNPNAIVYSPTGDLYVSDSGNNTVRKVTSAGVVSTLASGIANAYGITMSAAGDLYVTSGSEVKKITVGGVVSSFASGFSVASTLAFDTNGNLFVGNYGNSTISKVTSGGVVSTFATGVDSPFGLAFDRTGLLYVAHRDINKISTVSAGGVLTDFASGFSGPHEMEFDSLGNLYVADRWSPRIAKVSTNGVVTTYAAGLSAPYGLAWNAAGELLYSDYLVGNTLSRLYLPVIVDSATNGMADLPFTAGETYITDPNDAPTALSLSTNVFSAPQSADATLATLTTTDADAADTHAYSLVSGVGDADNASFNVVGNQLRVGAAALAARQYNVRIKTDDGQGGSLTNSFNLRLVDEVLPSIASIVRKYPTSQSAHTNRVVYEVTFTEPVEGVTTDRFSLTPENGSDIVGSISSVSGGPTAYEVMVDITSGTGDFRLVASGQSAPTLYATTFSTPWGLAFATNEALYVSHYGSNTVSSVSTNGSASVMASSLSGPTGLAVDATGTLYASYAILGRVYRISTNGTKTLFATGTGGARGLAFAPDRRLFVAGYTGNALYRVETNGSRSTLTTSLTTPMGVAIGPDGFVYISSFTGNSIVRVTTNGTITPFLTGLNAPVGLAFDAAGNLYVANSGDNTVLRVGANGVASAVATGFATPYGLAINGAGKLFVANYASNTISQVSLAMIADLAGNPVSPLPYLTGEIYTYTPNVPPTDIGLSNASINESAGPDAPVGTLSTTDSDSSDTHTYTLVSGTGDGDNGSFVVTTNQLTVGGTALAPGTYSVRIQTEDNHGGSYAEAFVVTVQDDVAPEITSVSSATGTYGVTFSYTITATGGATDFNAVGLPVGLSVNVGTGGITGTPAQTGGFSVTITAADAAGNTDTNSLSLSIAKAPAIVALDSLSHVYDGAGKSATAATTPSGLSVSLTYNGSSTLPTNAGSYTVVGTIAAANYTGAATNTLVISKASATVSLAGLSHVYDGAGKSATASTTPSGLSVSLTYDGSTTLATNAGSYTVVGTIAAVNYTGAATNTLVISEASATVSLAGLSHVYDGAGKSATA
ncbi:MAG: putative Ig domain-containing protein, partial [Verrucomicrobiales bacterium]|nr:putative Ig domain-containing protein [Verrucomicrobiales bacterium]